MRSAMSKALKYLKYAVSLQYLKKELSFEVDALYADEHESLLQVDSIILDDFWQYVEIKWVNLQ